MAAQAIAAGLPKMPAHLTVQDCDRPYLDEILKARPLVTWNDADLTLALTCAQERADAQRLRQEIRAEGETITNVAGNVVANPKVTLLDGCVRRAVALSRMLHVHAEATTGRSQEQPNKGKTQRAVEAAMAAVQSDDDLIPGISLN